MNRYDKKRIGNNVKALRMAIGLSQHDFSSLMEISKRTLANVESGETNVNLSVLSRILDFFNLGFDEISNSKMTINDDLREHLIQFHSDNKAYINLLTKKPNISYAIKYKLLKSTFFDEPREVNEVRIFFEGFGWRYLGTSISNALKKMSKSVSIESHPIKKQTNIYLNKKTK